jgi:hypothetical protein
VSEGGRKRGVEGRRREREVAGGLLEGRRSLPPLSCLPPVAIPWPCRRSEPASPAQLCSCSPPMTRPVALSRPPKTSLSRSTPPFKTHACTLARTAPTLARFIGRCPASPFTPPPPRPPLCRADGVAAAGDGDSGTVGDGRSLLELEDLARAYRHPCIVDIKVGCCGAAMPKMPCLSVVIGLGGCLRRTYCVLPLLRRCWVCGQVGFSKRKRAWCGWHHQLP